MTSSRAEYESRPSWRKISKRVLGAVAATATVLTMSGVPQASAKSQSEKETASQPGNRDPKSKETKRKPAKYGNVDLAALPLGTDYVTATRTNGEVIKVPRLDNSSPNTLAATALDLMACYFTTGSQECLNAFTTNDVVKKALEAHRNIDFATHFSRFTDSQYAIFDDKKDPAIFTVSTAPDGRELVSLSGGTLYAGRYQHPTVDRLNSWQNPVGIRTAGELELTIDKLNFFVQRPTATQPLSITGIDFYPTKTVS